MGMDVYGNKPKTDKGEYFRNNVWWWHPLWDYVYSVAADLIPESVYDHGHSNSGAGLGARDAKKLGKLLLDEIEFGRTAKYENDYRQHLANLPLEVCTWCNGVGIRTDRVGVEGGMPSKELDEATAIALGRTHGTCNGCNGEGKTQPWSANYPFSVENVRQFAEFCIESGGFKIW